MSQAQEGQTLRRFQTQHMNGGEGRNDIHSAQNKIVLVMIDCGRCELTIELTAFMARTNDDHNQNFSTSVSFVGWYVWSGNQSLLMMRRYFVLLVQCKYYLCMLFVTALFMYVPFV